MTPLQKAEKAVTDVHLRLDTLSARRAALAEQIGAAETEERKLLRAGTDLAELAAVRGRIVAGRDMTAEAVSETERLEAELEGLERNLAREAALADLGGACERGAVAAKQIDARLDRIARFLADELPALVAEHDELLAARSDYESGGKPLHPAWALSGSDRPRERDTAEGFLTRRGYSLRGIDPGGLKPPSSASAALQGAWAVYRQIVQAAWIRENIERERRQKAASAKRRRRLGLDA